MKWVKQDSVKEFWDSKEQKNICLLIWKPVVLEFLKLQYTNTYFFFSHGIKGNYRYKFCEDTCMYI